jgi:filamentous hemagglutinin family protein
MLLGLVFTYPAGGQVVPDATLPSRSVVTRNGNRIRVSGGTRAGGNLFHSFREFSVPRRGAVSFRAIEADIANIIARVTGSSRSRIDGAIEVLQADGSVSPANFFLINPNGILFGPQASLNLGGSFLATTARGLRFADGTSFDAAPANAAPLLTVSVPSGLQFGNRPGRIVNRSIVASQSPLDPPDDPLVGLRVAPGRTLALVGGAIDLPGGELTAAAGRIELGSVAGGERVRLLPAFQGWRLAYSGVNRLDQIRLWGAADLDASGVGGGAVRLRGDRILITDQSNVTANTLGSQDGRGIAIRASQLVVRNGAQIAANTLAAGRGGTVSIAAQSVELSDVSRTNGIPDLDSGLPLPSGIFARVGNGASGSGGRLSIATRQLTIRDGAQVSTSTRGAGNAGNLKIRASQVELADVARSANGNALTFQGVPAAPSSLSTVTSAAGRAGNLTVTTQRLSLRDGAVLQTSTQGSGNAGRLRIRASESIQVSGTAAGLSTPTGLLTFSGGIPDAQLNLGNASAIGRGGTAQISTRTLQVRDGAAIAVGSLNRNAEARGAGNLRIEAQTVQLADQGRLIAETASGNGGNISLQVPGVVLLRGNSDISTTAGLAGTGGDGGKIRIDAGYIVSNLTENSDIRANAFTGRGGDVTIAVRGIVGIEPQDRNTARSDITASSELGTSGTIQINSPVVDLTRGLVELPVSVVDVSSLINQSCAAGNYAAQTSSEFVVTGRGGLPPSPVQPQQSESVVTDWATLASDGQERAEATRTAARASSSSSPLVEAQGWVVDASGAVTLVADAATAAPHPEAIAPPTCQSL